MHYANQLSQNTLLVATIKEYAACVHPSTKHKVSICSKDKVKCISN